jgi:hypothetical protein
MPTQPNFGPLLAALLAYAAADFLALPVLAVLGHGWAGDLATAALGGLVVAQAFALAMAGVFGPGPFALRLTIAWILAAILFMQWLLGYFVFAWIGRNSTEALVIRDARYVACSLPLFALAMQLPLWALKFYAGWRWVRADGPRDAKGSGVFGGTSHSILDNTFPPKTPDPLAPEAPTIRDYLLGTAIVAVSLSLAPLSEESREANFWLGWAVVGAVAALISLISVPPAMLLTMRSRGWSEGALLAIPCTLAVMLVVILGMATFIPSFARELFSGRGLVLVGTFLTSFMTFAAGLLLATRAAGALGYRFLMGRGTSARVQ